MAILSFEIWELNYVVSSSGKNAHILPPEPQIKKLRTLSFLQLLKFEKVKYPHFLNLWLRGRHIGLFSRDDGTYSSS